MYCKQCGNELNGNSTYCSKCGAKLESESKAHQTNAFAIIGLIVAGISVFLNFWGVVGIAAVILSSVGLIQINKTGEMGKSIAITGISIGAISIIYGFIMVLALI